LRKDAAGGEPMKAECGQHRERFGEYLDGEMPEADRNALEAHVAECAECRRELNLLHQTIRTVAELPKRSAPAGFGERVARSIAAGRAPAEGRRLIVLCARALPVAAMLALVLGLLVYVPGRKPTSGPAEVRHLAMARRVAEPEASGARAAAGEAVAAVPAEALREEGIRRLSPVAMMREDASQLADRLERVTGFPAGAPHARAPLGETGAVRGVAGVRGRDERELLGPPALSWRELETPEDESLRVLQAGVPFVFTQVASERFAEPAGRAQQVFTVMAEEPIAVMRRTVAVANGIGVAAALRVEPEDKDDGGVDVFLTVPAARYDGLLKELVKLAPPEKQSLANTDVGSGEFFEAMLANYAFYKGTREADEKSKEGQTVAAPARSTSLAFGAVRTTPETAAPAEEARRRAGRARYYWAARAGGPSNGPAAPVSLVIRIQKPAPPAEARR